MKGLLQLVDAQLELYVCDGDDDAYIIDGFLSSVIWYDSLHVHDHVHIGVGSSKWVGEKRKEGQPVV